MSVLPNQTNINVTDEFFVNDVANISFISSINVFNGSLNTGHIQLDQVGMDCAILNSSPTLLLNGVPVASVSSFASSITQWASYPALAPITYATGAGSGGAINMANVNALSNVSSATGTFGNLSSITGATIGGYPYPMRLGAWNKITLPNPPATVLNITNGQIVSVDMTGQPAGLYVIIVNIQSGGVDPWSCQFIVSTGTAAGVVCCGTHFPSWNPYGTQPTGFNNMITAQSASLGGSTADIIFFSTGVAPNGILGSTAQLELYRIY
jgi:hypothetical protein